MSTFNLDTFIDQDLTAEVSTEIIPCPVGDWQAKITKVTPKTWAKKDDPSVNGVLLEIDYEIVDQAAKEEAGIDKLMVRGSVPLEIAEDGKSLATGKGVNVPLGKLLQAAGCNRTGIPLSALVGQIVLVNVIQEEYEGNMYAKAKKVAAIH